MASNKKASEGIALLSMYNDEDDEEMEEMEEDDQGRGGEEQLKQAESKDNMQEDSGPVVNETMPPVPRDNSVPSILPLFSASATSPQQEEVVPSETKRSGTGRLTIVDYGHDEVAMSPEIEEREHGSSDQVMYGVEHQTATGKTPLGAAQLTPQLSDMEPSQPVTVSHAVGESEAIEVEEAVKVSEEDADLLDKFLPPPPKAKCSEELQRKINKFLNLKRAGKSFNAEVRNRKDYRNPDFLLHAVSYQDIDPIGSNFSKDVFDPHGYDKSDFIDEIEADMKREKERKEQESKKNLKLDFVATGFQPAPKVNMPIAGASAGAASALHSAPTAADNVARGGRSKKSKWDKVEGDRRIPPAGGQESLSTVVAHTAVPSATNASGYAAYAQQRRREAEEKRSTEKNRRS
ncbi:hypothetical protein SLE2022_388850 [Rubroshorea leprosula]